MQGFMQTDCWVLFSIGFGPRGSTLKQIISTGDFLNHAILTQEEPETSLNRLFYNGYITFADDKFYTTDKAKIFLMIIRSLPREVSLIGSESQKYYPNS